MTRDELIAFEEDIAAEFNAGKIKAPVHLAGGNEDQLIDIFKTIRPQDWILCGWRSHYHCLLKGVPPALLKQKIMEGRSIALCFQEYRVLSSAIVGGICPIAVGLAWAIKQRDRNHPISDDAKVYAFIGDMTAHSGLLLDSLKYAAGHQLPLHWVVEDNGLSVCTDTVKSWGHPIESPYYELHYRRYGYKMTKPHVGTGAWVSF